MNFELYTVHLKVVRWKDQIQAEKTVIQEIRPCSSSLEWINRSSVSSPCKIEIWFISSFYLLRCQCWSLGRNIFNIFYNMNVLLIWTLSWFFLSGECLGLTTILNKKRIFFQGNDKWDCNCCPKVERSHVYMKIV